MWDDSKNIWISFQKRKLILISVLGVLGCSNARCVL